MAKSKESGRDDSAAAAVEWLAGAIVEATRTAKSCVSGRLPIGDPGLDIDGVGKLKFPLKPATVKKLLAHCRTAPYGQGTQTLVDTRVRKTFELDPESFRLDATWNLAIAETTRAIAEQLALPSDRLEARLYKLLVYNKGGFFLPHRDSEKHDGMVASLIVVLPNPFKGGKLVVRHRAVEQNLTFPEAAAGDAACYAAFFADCEHEVERVVNGVRVCLSYNLVVSPKNAKTGTVPSEDESTDRLAAALREWVANQPAKPLVFALEHHYTERGLSFDLMKGGDRQLANSIAPAADRADCHVYLAQVTRHLQQFAEDGSYGDRYSRRRRGSGGYAIEIGETYEDELNGTEWADLQGEKQPWGRIPFDSAAIVAATPIDQWKPTSEEYEGYTGNAGNTLDRWYHRSALVVWHRDHHFEVVVAAGAIESMPLFLSMSAKLAKTPKKRLEGARADCVRCARAIIAQWPHRFFQSWRSPTAAPSPLDEFPARLLALRDRDAIALFLAKLAGRDRVASLESVILTGCREFGWDAFADELKQLLTAQIEPHETACALRDVEWLRAFCTDSAADPKREALALDLCALAAARFCEPRSVRDSVHRGAEATPSERSLPLLLEALLAGGRDEDVARVLAFVEQSPDAFTLDYCQVGSLKRLFGWSLKRFGSVPGRLSEWLAAVRGRLESATARKPEPPADWARAANLTCACPRCATLRAFLADRSLDMIRIPLNEHLRAHVIQVIQRHQCDVKHSVERRGSPYSLVLTKTTGSFDRALKRFEMDCRLLDELPASP